MEPVCGNPGAVLMGANCTTPGCGSGQQITASRLVTTAPLIISIMEPAATTLATVSTTVSISTAHPTEPTTVSINKPEFEPLSPSTYEMETQRELLELERDVVTKVSVTYCH